jgi:LPXTG-site transpeptidase (sortase) family protein
VYFYQFPEYMVKKRVKKAPIKSILFLNPVFGGLLGIILVVAGVGYLGYKRTVLSFSGIPATATRYDRSTLPVNIAIPTLNLNVPISEAAIQNGIWQTHESNVTHLNISASPGQSGNIILYGHNTEAILGKLSQTKIGDKIILTTKLTPTKHIYTINNIQIVSPDDLASVQPSQTEILTLYTCVGWLDNQRLIIQAIPDLSP